MNKSLLHSMKNIKNGVAWALLIVTLFSGFFINQTGIANALPQSEIDIISKNAVHWAVPSLGCGATNTGDNASVVWNFFIGKQLTPIATAGIMGNFHEETGGTFDPAIKQNHTTKALPDGGDGVTGYGIAQWTYITRQAALFEKIRAAGLEKYYGAGYGQPETNKTKMPTEDVAKLLEVELLFAWEQDSTKISDLASKLNAATSVEGNTGSAYIFHADYERSADGAAGLQERSDQANAYLARFGSTSTGSASCSSGTLGGVSTPEDAIAWADKFVADTKAQYSSDLAVATSLNKKPYYNAGFSLYIWPESSSFVCWGAYGCDECVTLTGWFVTKMTNYSYGGGNGGDVVGRLRAKGVPTGKEPKPFSVFSTRTTSSYGHTGLVLGVFEGGTVITLENNVPSNTLTVMKYNIKSKYPDVEFAYTGDKLKPEVSSAVGGN